jgi:hypothetical protein
VFDCLQWDLGKNHRGMDNFVNHKKFGFDRLEFVHPEAQSFAALKNKDLNNCVNVDTKSGQADQGVRNGKFQTSKEAGYQEVTSYSKFCIHCLRMGHWRATCRQSFTCHKCFKSRHYSSTCHGIEQVGFKPKMVTTDCF